VTARRTLILALAIAVVSPSVAAASPYGKSPLERVSNRGTPVALTPALKQAIERSPAAGGRTRLLARRKGASVYWIGGDCLAVAGGVSALTTMVCESQADPQAFPSRRLPVLNGTIVTSNLPPGQSRWRLRFQRIVGVAADGVTSMELRTASGKRITRVAVVGNVYVFPKSDRIFTEPVVLVALDRSGKAVYSHKYSPMPPNAEFLNPTGTGPGF
jgi:hypothetical protein